jgi:putative nucleotidyltransferase with HDIG domain
VIRGWYPPFVFRAGQVLLRDVVVRHPFQTVNQKDTERAREAARRQVRWVYQHKPSPLDQVTAKLENAVGEVLAAETLAAVNPQVWADFAPRSEGVPVAAEEESQQRFTKLKQALAADRGLVEFRKSVADAVAPFRERGLLGKQAPKMGQGNDEIEVYPAGHPEQRRTVKLADVVIGSGTALRAALRNEFESADVAECVCDWLERRLTPTLDRDEDETKKAMDQAARAVADEVVPYAAGDLLAAEGQPLTADQVHLLRLEYEASMAARPWSQKVGRATAVVALIVALFGLAATYVIYREPRLTFSLGRLGTVLAMLVVTVGLSRWAASDPWRAELVPMLFFGQTLAIGYRREMALMLSAIAALVLALALGHGLAILLLLLGVTTTAIVQLGRIRSRSKLIYVGLIAGLVAFPLTVGLAVLDNQPLGKAVWLTAGVNALWTLGAGFLITGLLPFIEKAFGVLTDMSLLELGDVSHPLLQQLVQRAPATYNHSITVGSVAEAAAEAIGARGLLVRIGAYYHDVGKMLKPGYFMENQSPANNRHETLVPTMSTLVIVAHIKDGADLARQHGLPPPIIDFIEQHHGTTLVEYFFGRAHEQHQADPNGASVDENLYRYPGPKPQTKEAGVLMLADAVESASRSLVDPAPARIASLVREIAERKLDDGQFDESGLTLRELRTIEDSVTKSLIANYHGRVKYPEQKTA